MFVTTIIHVFSLLCTFKWLFFSYLLLKNNGDNTTQSNQLNVVVCSADDSWCVFSLNPPSWADVPPELSVLLAGEGPSSPLGPSRSLWAPAPWRWPSLQSLPPALPPLTGGLVDQLSPPETFTTNMSATMEYFYLWWIKYVYNRMVMLITAHVNYYI